MNQGRENVIIAQALFEAVRYLDRLPENRRPVSDIKDMLEILNSRYPGQLKDMINAEKMRPLPPPIARLVVPAKPSEDEPAQ